MAVENQEEQPTEPVPAEEVQAAVDAANNNSEENNPDSEESVWSKMAEDVESDESENSESTSEKEEEQVPAESTPAEPASTPSAETPAVEPKPEPVAAEVPATPPSEVAAQQPVAPQVPAQEQAVPPTPQQTPEEYQRLRQETRAKAVESLAEQFSLSDEDATNFITDPAAVVPKFRAELFLDVFDAVTGALVKAVPGIIQQTNTQAAEQEQHENAFYEANPKLDKKLHGDTVNRFAQAYVQAVPGVTRDQLIKDVGVQVMYALGINPAQEAPAEQVPAEPSAPAAYVPAGAGGQPAPVSSSTSGNIWGDIAEQLTEDED